MVAETQKYIINLLTIKNYTTMKRTMMILLLALLTVSTAMAQYPARRYRRPVPPPRPVYRSDYSYRDSYRRQPVNDIYYGFRVGANISNVRSDDPYLDGGSAKAGVNLGFVAGFQLVPRSPVYVETGLLYSEKGGKGNCNGHSFTYALNYLEVPFVLKAMMPLDHQTTVQPFVGIYASAGVGGKIKDFNQRQAYSAFDDEGFERFDAGLRLGCGLQYANLYAELGYDLGLANVSHDYFDTAHTGAFFATIGVNL